MVIHDNIFHSMERRQSCDSFVIIRKSISKISIFIFGLRSFEENFCKYDSEPTDSESESNMKLIHHEIICGPCKRNHCQKAGKFAEWNQSHKNQWEDPNNWHKVGDGSTSSLSPEVTYW